MIHEDKPTLEEALIHYGVKGMKWGVRRGKSTTGQSRFLGAKTQANDRMIRDRERAAKGVRGKIPGYKKRQEKQIKRLKDSNKRIEEGRLKVRDILDVYSRVGYTDLLFTKTPK